MSVWRMMLFLTKTLRKQRPVDVLPRRYWDPANTPELKTVAQHPPFAIGAATFLQTLDDHAMGKVTLESIRRTNHQMLAQHFNSATPGNVIKWKQLLKDPAGDIFDYDFTRADASVNNAIEAGCRVRGHCLLWGKFKGRTYPVGLDTMIKQANDARPAMRGAIQRHIETVMHHFGDRINVWDVVNETLFYSRRFRMDGIFYDVLGEEHLDVAFHAAHAARPTARLVLNETLGQWDGPKAQQHLAMVRRLLDRGVPIHRIGMQGHTFNVGNFHPDAMLWYADQLQAMDLTFEITEFDWAIPALRHNDDPLQSQAQLLYDSIRDVAAHPACVGFTWWGITDAHCWYDHIWPFNKHQPARAFLLDDQLEKKPLYAAMAQVLADRNQHLTHPFK